MWGLPFSLICIIISERDRSPRLQIRLLDIPHVAVLHVSSPCMLPQTTTHAQKNVSLNHGVVLGDKSHPLACDFTEPRSQAEASSCG
jgi:hypothetical protein